jgi:hypothetical protein
MKLAQVPYLGCDMQAAALDTVFATLSKDRGLSIWDTTAFDKPPRRLKLWECNGGRFQTEAVALTFLGGGTSQRSQRTHVAMVCHGQCKVWVACGCFPGMSCQSRHLFHQTVEEMLTHYPATLQKLQSHSTMQGTFTPSFEDKAGKRINFMMLYFSLVYKNCKKKIHTRQKKKNLNGLVCIGISSQGAFSDVDAAVGAEGPWFVVFGHPVLLEAMDCFSWQSRPVHDLDCAFTGLRNNNGGGVQCGRKLPVRFAVVVAAF